MIHNASGCHIRSFAFVARFSACCSLLWITMFYLSLPTRQSTTSSSPTKFEPIKRDWNLGIFEFFSDDADNENVFKPQLDTLVLCPSTPPNLNGKRKLLMNEMDWEFLEDKYSAVEKGGHHKPSNCKSRQRVAIIVPYRNRSEHMRIFLDNFHSFLPKQQLDYVIFFVEPIGNQTFNRAKLFNIGFTESLKLYPFDCFIIHDVDLIPEDDRNIYQCSSQPRHLTPHVSTMNYKLWSSNMFGGAAALTKDQMESTNGFSNDYWGWGSEDDDMGESILLAGYNISRYPDPISRYTMSKHKHQGDKSNPLNKCREQLRRETKRRYLDDGLSNLRYTNVNITFHKLYTHLLVDLLENESREALRKESNRFKDC